MKVRSGLIRCTLVLMAVWSARVAWAVPGARECPTVEFVEGIDVSHWQGNINWNSVAADGKAFAFIKATEGVNFIDSRFYQNIQGATAAGLYAGAYHFATPYTGGVNDAADEASDFVQAAGGYFGDGYLPPVLDLETQSALGSTTLSNWAKTFLDTVEDLSGVRPILYTSANYASNFLNAAVVQTELWIAHWGVSTPNTGTWGGDYDFWQYSSTGSVSGISGNVDLNYFNGNAAQLFQMVNPIIIPEPASALVFCAVALMGMRTSCRTRPTAHLPKPAGYASACSAVKASISSVVTPSQSSMCWS